MKRLLIFALFSWCGLASAAPVGTATKTDVCIHYVTDFYFDIPWGPIYFPNFTAQRWTYYYVCHPQLNFVLCYQSPTSYPNGNVFECQSNIAVDSNGNYDPSNTISLNQNDPLMSAAVIVTPIQSKKYYKTCTPANLLCNKALVNINNCMVGKTRSFKTLSCLSNAGAQLLAP